MLFCSYPSSISSVTFCATAEQFRQLSFMWRRNKFSYSILTRPNKVETRALVRLAPWKKWLCIALKIAVLLFMRLVYQNEAWNGRPIGKQPMHHWTLFTVLLPTSKCQNQTFNFNRPDNGVWNNSCVCVVFNMSLECMYRNRRIQRSLMNYVMMLDLTCDSKILRSLISLIQIKLVMFWNRWTILA